jgi:hypothetical protein
MSKPGKTDNKETKTYDVSKDEDVRAHIKEITGVSPPAPNYESGKYTWDSESDSSIDSQEYDARKFGDAFTGLDNAAKGKRKKGSKDKNLPDIQEDEVQETPETSPASASSGKKGAFKSSSSSRSK